MGGHQAKEKRPPRHNPNANKQASVPKPASSPATTRVDGGGTSFSASNQKAKDVMISYSHQDIEVMRKLASELKLCNKCVYHCN